MPSITFFHLPEEKRERLMAAARAEFTRVPYEEASINQIIREAGIPRGSFYMYFTDKEDLFRYLMESYSERLIQRMRERLEWNGGDLFAASLALFDHVQANWRQGEFREMADILRCNRQLQPGLVLHRSGPCAILERLRDRIDLSKLDLRTETDLSDLFHLPVAAAAGAVVSGGNERSPEQVRARLVRMLELLQRGAAAKNHTECQG